jgi:hypothetical protein
MREAEFGDHRIFDRIRRIRCVTSEAAVVVEQLGHA